MKFLCPQCKAKYRIADEKLAQRASSRMKCRKCGHVIDIRSAIVPESIRPPGAPSADEDESEDEAPRKDVPRVAPAPAGGPPPRRVGGAPAPKRPQSPTKRPAVTPPRRGGAAAAVQAVAEKASPAIADASVEKPPARNEFEEDLPTRIHDGGALTAAFSLAVEDSPGAAASPSIQEEWYIGIDGSPLGPISLAQLREKASIGKATLDSLVWRDGFEEWRPLRDFPELVALVEESRPGSVVIAPEPHTVPAPGVGRIGRGAVDSDLPADVLEQIGKSRKTASHPAAWAAILVAMAFGVTVGIVLFSKTEKQVQVKYVEVPASAKPSDPTVGGDNNLTLEEATVSGTNGKHTGGPAAKNDPVAAVPSAGKGLSGLSGLNGLNGLGPATTGPDVAKDTAPGGQLDGVSIQRVVANFSPSVRRGCWDQAIATRAPDAPSSARVGVTITISGSGGVDNVTTTGDPKGYPNLAHCIEAKVRAWRFPRSSGTTTANVPFVFAVQ